MAADQGSSHAAYNLGFMYKNGEVCDGVCFSQLTTWLCLKNTRRAPEQCPPWTVIWLVSLDADVRAIT